MAPLGDLYVTWTGGDREVLLAPPGARGGDSGDTGGSGDTGDSGADEEDYR